MDVDAIAPSSGVRIGKGASTRQQAEGWRMCACRHCGGCHMDKDCRRASTAAPKAKAQIAPAQGQGQRWQRRQGQKQGQDVLRRAMPPMRTVGSQGGDLLRRHVHRGRGAWSGFREHHVGSLERRSVRQRLGSAAADRFGCMPQRVPPQLVLRTGCRAATNCPQASTATGKPLTFYRVRTVPCATWADAQLSLDFFVADVTQPILAVADLQQKKIVPEFGEHPALLYVSWSTTASGEARLAPLLAGAGPSNWAEGDQRDGRRHGAGQDAALRALLRR